MVGRLFGSKDSIAVTKFLSSLEYWFGMAVNDPLTIFRARNCKDVAVNGWVKAQSSYNTTPIDQMSLWKE